MRYIAARLAGVFLPVWTRNDDGLALLKSCLFWQPRWCAMEKAKRTILVVEDEPLIQVALAAEFRRSRLFSP